MSAKEMKTLTIGGVQYKITDENIGLLENLNTTQKSTIVDAINELVANSNSGIDSEQVNTIIQEYLAKNPPVTEESDPTVPAWAKESTKPSYTKSEVGLGNVDNVKQYSADNPPPYPVTSVNGETGAVEVTAEKIGAMPATTKIPSKTSDLTNDSGFLTGYTESDPTVPDWAKQASKPEYTASEVGADASGTAASQMSTHNEDASAHADIREQLSQLSSEKVNVLDIAQGLGDDPGFVMSQKAVTEAIMDLKAQGMQQTPLFANSIEECTDTSKLYVLPDDMIYAYKLTQKEVESGGGYTNLLPLATDTDRTTIYNGIGYKVDTRLSSSGSTGATAAGGGVCASGFIPAKDGDTVRIKSISGSSDTNIYAITYDSSNTKIMHQQFSPKLPDDAMEWYTTKDGVITFQLSSDYFGTGIDALRFSAVMSADTVVTINEEIIEGGGTTIVEEWTWASTGHAFIPADYEDRIIAVEESVTAHTARIVSLEKAVKSGGVDETEAEAYTRIKNWQYPIHEDAPVFLLETDKPALTSADYTTDAIYAKYDALMAANSHYITKQDCGMASDGTTPIYVYHFKGPEPHYNGTWSETKPVILVCSGVHPTEQSGVWSMYYAMEEITTNAKLLDLRRNLHIIVMPMINPTGFSDSTYGVRNPDGIQVHYNFEVDFKYPTDSGYAAHGNRNHGGETPLSIPETQYFDALMEEYKDTLACVLSCHNNDIDTQWGTGFIWSSCATHFMCNLGFRLVDKLSAAWREKHGNAFEEGVRWANNYALTKKAEGSSIFPNAVEQAEWDYRVGRASISSSGGTEYKQALKYGVHGINVEVCDRCMILDRDFYKTRTANVITMGCETYVNFFRTFMAVYDPKSKKEYAPNLPWSE